MASLEFPCILEDLAYARLRGAEPLTDQFGALDLNEGALREGIGPADPRNRRCGCARESVFPVPGGPRSMIPLIGFFL